MNNILFFAQLKEAVGQEHISIDGTGKTIAEIKGIIVEKYPSLDLSAVMTAVNEEFALDDDLVEENDTIAFIPPVSGG